LPDIKNGLCTTEKQSRQTAVAGNTVKYAPEKYVAQFAVKGKAYKKDLLVMG
jgi:hypothetical protein